MSLPDYFQPGTDPTKQDPRIHMPVKFTSGKFIGFQGVIQWAGEVCCSVVFPLDNKRTEVVEDFVHLIPVALLATRSST